MATRRGTKAYRKVEKVLSGESRSVSAAGPSLLESLEKQLLQACRKYYRLRTEDHSVDDSAHEYDVALATWRGIMQGLASAVAKIRLPYENQKVVTKQVTNEFYRRAKEIENG